MRQLNIQTVTWPAAGEFRISRSALTAFPMVQVKITDGQHCGRGECRPYARYNETPQTVIAQIETIRTEIKSGLDLDALQSALPAGAARNAVDCALWDLKAKTESRPVWEMLGLRKPKPRVTAYTLSLDTPAKMAAAAANAAQYPVLKIKIAGIETLDCVTAILDARPDAKLIIDANEALDLNSLGTLQSQIPDGSTLLIEQPLPASEKRPFAPALSPPICADEALHTRQDLDALWAQGYRAVNIKLDKCGGLTEGLLLAQQAKTMGFTIMAGCMVGSSLAMAPMVMLESFAEVIDLDGPLLLSEDIENGLIYDGPTVYPPTAELWG